MVSFLQSDFNKVAHNFSALKSFLLKRSDASYSVKMITNTVGRHDTRRRKFYLLCIMMYWAWILINTWNKTNQILIYINKKIYALITTYFQRSVTKQKATGTVSNGCWVLHLPNHFPTFLWLTDTFLANGIWSFNIKGTICIRIK